MTRKILGLDLGTNSIGWAVYDYSENAYSLADIGVRIFPKSVENKTEVPKSQKRRTARLNRRVLERRARRKLRLQNYLISLNLLPTLDSENRERKLNALGDPYVLRSRGLDHALNKHELGRAILHLGQRRGFLSARKNTLGELMQDPDIAASIEDLESDSDLLNTSSKEEGEFKAAISELNKRVKEANCRTLGEYLSHFDNSTRKRNQRISREMVRHELRLLFNAQRANHPELGNAQLAELETIIFHQRPLKWDRSTIDRCSLEPKNRCASKGRLEFQQFRYLQDLNNLRYSYVILDEDSGEISNVEMQLTPEDKSKLIPLLESQKSLSWSKIKKTIGLPKDVIFNLEEQAKTKGLSGNQTACDLRKITNGWWDTLDHHDQYALIEDLLSFEKKSALYRRLTEYWQQVPAIALALCVWEAEPGYANHCLKALKRLLPFLLDGQIYSDARENAEYPYEVKEHKRLHRLPRPSDLKNPVVNRALSEVRKVINAIVKKHGELQEVRIEMPREFKLSQKQKRAIAKQQKINEKLNRQAAKSYQQIQTAYPSLGLRNHPSHEDLLKYRLWEEQGFCCLYTGKSISQAQLFTPDVEIDHILPYSRSLDNSYLNKVLVLTSANREKGNRTPFEQWGDNTAAYEQLVQRCKSLPRGKRAKVLQKQLPPLDDFINSQLSDTAYISKKVKDYIACLGCKVTISRGATTAMLRHQWGLNSLLGGQVKNRTDHRHHAIDAAVIGLLSSQLYRKMASQATKYPGCRPETDSPLEDIRAVLADELDTMIVSHKPQRKVTGALHEDTGYSLSEQEGKLSVTVRKAVDSNFNEKMIATVVDQKIKEKLKAHLDNFNGNAKAAFSMENKPVLFKGQGQVRHVRIIAAKNYRPESYLTIKPKNRGKPFRLHPFGNNHHVMVWRENGKIVSCFSTAWQALQNLRQYNTPITPIEGLGSFTTLVINDTVSIQEDGQEKLYRVQALDPTGNRIVLRAINAATLDNKAEMVRKSVSVLFDKHNLQKKTVTLLGELLSDQENFDC